MFSSFSLFGAVLAVLNALPTTALALAFPTTTTPSDVNTTTSSSQPILETRYNRREIISVDCDDEKNHSGSDKWGKWEAAGNWDRFEDSIKYLNGVQEKLKNGRGPGNCGRDPKADKELDSYGEIAWAAEVVYDKCGDKGRISMKDQWSVVLKEDMTDGCRNGI
ncbi:hypothetical protein SMACR_05183 [Sordaria macrospora]|uniref:WGS project CABT00000000 data, contig 2.8 n=2 Tax=Sordaria macrospora TaxID=5147 RepID=F7VV53_SORMK|nr:uncharacterized protein SMAC_05183 [Sordaria macrospora k-hell]KAA8632423.1 hypothetical protein SMACR_05183 [Sordaria macrospora]KAH7628792.1 hypothetical protein B0T09DRAFT_267587 [Sordaria sp. MPI-SDFR-AT-0083]WPJ57301.1 hypothetical protein SMAC4_05183 [Sordaria macrospora]CCC09400.1 unnamed protein product [Sordaria macrospora k-hell]